MIETLSDTTTQIKVEWLTCCTSRPRAQTSVVMRTRVVPDRNSAMIASRSFCGMSPCIADTVKLLLLIFSVSQSTCPMSINKSDHIQVCVTAAAAVTVYETTFMQQATSSFIPNLLHLHLHKSKQTHKKSIYNSSSHMSSHYMLFKNKPSALCCRIWQLG